MTTPENQNTTTQQELEPFFPPIVLFAVSMIAFFVALAVWLTQGQLNIVALGALLVGVIAFIFWLVMNPKAVMDFVKGRGLAFGGTAIIVTVVMVVAAVLVYMVIASQQWSLDYTEGSILTVAENTRDVLETIANDPTAGNVRFVAFFATQDAAGRERFDILLREMEEASGGKVSYEYVDPDRELFVAEQYGENIRSGQIAVVPYDAEGNLVADEAELLTNPDQYSLTNMVIEVLADGDFRATFVQVPDGVDPEDEAGAQGAGSWVTYLRDVLGWTVNIITPLDLTTEAGLGELASDGDVLIIPGGIDALPDEAIAAIAAYVNQGGNLVLFAGPNLAVEPTLASADNMGNFLMETYGVRVRDDLVVDDAEHFVLQNLQLLSETYTSHPITDEAMTSGLIAVFSAAQSIEVAATPPTGVTVTSLITTTENAYAKTGIDVNAQIEQNVALEDFEALFAQAEGDTVGTLTLAAASDNTANSSRLVVFGSDTIIWNGFDGSRGESNPFLTQRAIFWTTGFDEFAASLATVRPLDETPPDQVLLEFSDVLYIRFVTVLLIPFGALIIGIAIWWARRERISG
jgi:ABC-2 type transport system permease protein